MVRVVEKIELYSGLLLRRFSGCEQCEHWFCLHQRNGNDGDLGLVAMVRQFHHAEQHSCLFAVCQLATDQLLRGRRTSFGGQSEVKANYIYSLLIAPNEISFHAELPLKLRAALIDTIITQIGNSQRQVGAFSGWVSGDVSWLKISNPSPGFPSDPGTPIAATAGFDYKVTHDWLVGLAFSLSTTGQSFSLGGDYRTEQVAVSGYAAYLHGLGGQIWSAPASFISM